MKFEADTFERPLAAEIDNRQKRIFPRRARARFQRVQFASNHVSDGALRGRLAARNRRDQPSVAKDSHLVRDLENLLQTVTHEQDGNALPLQVADKAEQFLNFMRGERSRRLIHD